MEPKTFEHHAGSISTGGRAALRQHVNSIDAQKEPAKKKIKLDPQEESPTNLHREPDTVGANDQIQDESCHLYLWRLRLNITLKGMRLPDDQKIITPNDFSIASIKIGRNVFAYKIYLETPETALVTIKSATPEVISILESLKAMKAKHQSHRLLREAHPVIALTQTITLEQELVKINFSARVQPLTNWSSASLQLGMNRHYKALLNLQYPDEALYPATVDSFYAAVQPPPMSSQQIENTERLKTHLMQYQVNAVHWMIERECGSAEQPNLWTPYTDDFDQVTFLQKELGLIADSASTVSESRQPIRGGLLCDEMGLGKTLEIIALILGHQRDLAKSMRSTALLTGPDLRPVSATLIICPATILHQWLEEVAKHSSLNACHYQGITRDGNVPDFSTYDIVITSFKVLSSELHFAVPESKRQLRNPPTYDRMKSPLVTTQFWRVVIDEAQMIQTGSTSAAQVAALIPRVHPWIVTGTPLSKDCTDLFGLMHFLHYMPIYGNPSLWSRLLASPYASDYVANVFNPISCRNTKALVSQEMLLPPQTIYLCEVDLTALEEQNFRDLLAAAFQDIGLDDKGDPREGTWENVELVKLQSWLLQLRQASTHPQIGGRNRAALSAISRPIQPLAEVLETMLESTKRELESNRRSLQSSSLLEGQVYEYDGKKQDALEMWLQALPTIDESVQRWTDNLLKVRADVSRSNTGKPTEDDSVLLEDKTYQSVAQDLRHWRVLLHKCCFYLGSIYFQMEETENEKEYYARAKKVRQELLQESEFAAQKSITSLTETKDAQDFVTIPEVKFPEQTGGIYSREILERLQILSETLNDQANQLDEWREQCIQKLLSGLADQDDDPSGEEYQQSLDAQAEAFSYHELVRFATNDRNEMVLGLTNNLLRTDMQRALDGISPDAAGEILRQGLNSLKKFRSNQELGSLNSMKSDLRAKMRNVEVDMLPERPNKTLHLELAVLKNALRHLENQFQPQKAALERLDKEVEVFSQVYNARVAYYRQFQSVSDDVREFTVLKRAKVTENIHDRLYAELDKALGREKKQELEEDDITKEERAHRIQDQLAKIEIEKIRLKRAIDHGVTRSRYLDYLGSEKAADASICTICTSTIEIGAFTICAHIFCRDCFQQWFKEHRACPICKTVLRTKDAFQTITLKTRAPSAKRSSTTPLGKVAKDDSSLGRLYATIDQDSKRIIKQQTLRRSYSSKVDSIVRHIKSLPRGSKSVLFSVFGDVLVVFQQALNENGILTAQLATESRKARGSLSMFMDDPACEVLLMSGKSQSAGLTLVNATNIFLVEPLLSPTVEQQVISRIHRIGQTKPTNVFQFAVSGLEMSILERSASRKLQALEHPMPRTVHGRESAVAGHGVEHEAGDDEEGQAGQIAAQTSEVPGMAEAVWLFRQNFDRLQNREELLLGRSDTLVGRI